MRLVGSGSVKTYFGTGACVCRPWQPHHSRPQGKTKRAATRKTRIRKSRTRKTRIRGLRILAEMSERFYVNCPLTPGHMELSGSEAKHLATVCRLGAGDEIRLFNGDACEYPARV